MPTLFIVYTNNSTLNQELNLVEQEAIAGLDIVRAILNLFPDNAILIQFFAYLNSIMFLVDTDRKRIQAIIKNFTAVDVITDDDIMMTGEVLATELGRIIEAKIAVNEIKTRLENL
ncbi:hypothetical protein B7486_36330 [cyanobacterium TDX16]|nr:hypothetical protein B7486_36330 [cyanobacterium TDX16]